MHDAGAKIPACAQCHGADKGGGAAAIGQLAHAGSPGGALIIHYTAKSLYGVLDWGMTPQQAVEAPNINSFQMRNSFQDHTARPGVMLVASSGWAIPKSVTLVLPSCVTKM